uniref:Uncharacterized protein n=1 Tax=Setaria viridis TaxID=4556 RepID=A0A4U6W3G5_SETVI|nr:hypothetical protein SEVIR_2G416400v2 [Setaria viridis]
MLTSPSRHAKCLKLTKTFHFDHLISTKKKNGRMTSTTRMQHSWTAAQERHVARQGGSIRHMKKDKATTSFPNWGLTARR